MQNIQHILDSFIVSMFIMSLIENHMYSVFSLESPHMRSCHQME